MTWLALLLASCAAAPIAPLSNHVGYVAPEYIRPMSIRHCAEFRFVTVDIGRCWWAP